MSGAHPTNSLPVGTSDREHVTRFGWTRFDNMATCKWSLAPKQPLRKRLATPNSSPGLRMPEVEAARLRRGVNARRPGPAEEPYIIDDVVTALVERGTASMAGVMADSSPTFGSARYR